MLFTNPLCCYIIWFLQQAGPDIIFISSILMMEKNNLFEISEAEPADVGPNHESPDSATVLLPLPCFLSGTVLGNKNMWFNLEQISSSGS